MKAVIIANGEIVDDSELMEFLADASLIICADGGARHLERIGVAPDVLIGDLDSINRNDEEQLRNMGVPLFRYPTHKDETDTEIALEYALEQGADEILFLGCTGTRLDHSLANVFLLSKLVKLGKQGCIADRHNRIYMTDSQISLHRLEGWHLSLIPVTQCVYGVTTSGLSYPLKDATLYQDSSLGISNEFMEDKAVITVQKGMLLVMVTRD